MFTFILGTQNKNAFDIFRIFSMHYFPMGISREVSKFNLSNYGFTATYENVRHWYWIREKSKKKRKTTWTNHYIIDLFDILLTP